jgi:PIN domain nuclease of toxin-antitoxin system
VDDRPILLDASALVILLLKQKGWQAVEQLLQSGRALTTVTGLAEAFNVCRLRGTGFSRNDIWNTLESLGLSIEPLTADDAAEIAYLQDYAEKVAKKRSHAGNLSLGDACCLAVGKRLGAVVVASDGFWDLLQIQGVEIFQLR